MTAPSQGAILDLANSHSRVSDSKRAVYNFTKRDLLAFAAALLELAPPNVDAERLDALADAAGFVRGTADGEPAFRVLGNESWHPDLRTAIDDHKRAKIRAVKADL